MNTPANLLQRVLLFVISVFLNVALVHATHIRAGELRAERVSSSSLTYKFSLIGYADTGSQVAMGGGHIDFGDGTEGELFDFFNYQLEDDLGGGVKRNQMDFTHTFQVPGTYVIRYEESNRNDGILNLSNSIDTRFYIELQLVIDPFLGNNSSPMLFVPPVDRGVTGVTFYHQPGAYDPDGDSLSYELTIPKQENDREVDDYLWPNDPSFYDRYLAGNEDQTGTPGFEIDSVSGLLIWDAPGIHGEYVVAMKIIEWRKLEGKWYQMGYLMRDMQIIIEDSKNTRPRIETPKPICIAKGTTIEQLVEATDPDGHELIMNGFGLPFDQVVAPAMSINDDGIGVFKWETDAVEQFNRPFDVFLKISDDPQSVDDGIDGPSLTEYATWQVSVKPPAPTGLTINIDDEITLDWDGYHFDDINQMRVWRRVGEFDLLDGNCHKPGLEADGFSLLTSLDSDVHTFSDKRSNLAAGAQYCYRVQGSIQNGERSTSLPSNQVCFEVPVTSAIPIEVSVEETSKTNGSIQVTWDKPADYDQSTFTEPFYYELKRRRVGDDAYNTVRAISRNNLLDASIDTENESWEYKIDTYDANDQLVGESANASTVELKVIEAMGFNILIWNADVPWSNYSVSPHKIYRVYNGSTNFELIGEKMPGENMSFIDHDIVQYEEYAYYVETIGTYGGTTHIEPIVNLSQIVKSENRILETTLVDKMPYSFYPNPIVNHMNIQGLQSDEKLIVINTLGQISKVIDGNGRIDMIDLLPGVYLLVHSDGHTSKFIKQ